MTRRPTEPPTPIVLQHGLFGFGELQLGALKFGYFHGIDRAFAERGHPVIISRVHPTGSIELRARQLKATLLKQLKSLKCAADQRVVIFAHSMGGLDARYMITHLGMNDRVAALVTISTPHRGSSFADWCLLNLGQKLRAMQLFRALDLDVRAAYDLTTDSCEKFNRDVPNAKDVRYFSISASRPWYKVMPLFIHSARIIDAAEGANDGLVSVTSAKWGEHLETWEADHLHAVNRRMAIELKNPTGDMRPRYLKILDRLVEEKLCTAPQMDAATPVRRSAARV
jgi:triacylglycerol lipase